MLKASDFLSILKAGGPNATELKNMPNMNEVFFKWGSKIISGLEI